MKTSARLFVGKTQKIRDFEKIKKKKKKKKNKTKTTAMDNEVQFYVLCSANAKYARSAAVVAVDDDVLVAMIIIFRKKGLGRL